MIEAESESSRGRSKLKRVLLILGGATVAVTLLGFLFSRVFQRPLPREWSGFVVEDERFSFTDESQDAFGYRYVNLPLQATLLKDELMKSGQWEAEPLRGQQEGGWFMRSLDPSSPYLNIQIDLGRFHTGKSMFYYDHDKEDGWSAGWSAVLVTYRPSVISRVDRFVQKTIPEKFFRRKIPSAWTVVINDEDVQWRRKMISEARSRSQARRVE